MDKKITELEEKAGIFISWIFIRFFFFIFFYEGDLSMELNVM